MTFEEQVKDLIEACFLAKVPAELWNENRKHTFHVDSTFHFIGRRLFPPDSLPSRGKKGTKIAVGYEEGSP